MRAFGGPALVLSMVVAGPALACPDWPTAPGIHVAPSGRDSGAGTIGEPFRTLERARQAAAGVGLHRVYIDSGIYDLDRTLVLEVDDSFLSIIGCRADPPMLDAGQAGLETLIEVRDATGVTLTGLTLVHATGPAVAVHGATYLRITHNGLANNGTGLLLAGTTNSLVCANRIAHSAASGIEAKDGSDDDIFAHNVIDGTGAPHTHGGGIFVHGASRSRIVRNRVENTSGVGIGVLNWDGSTINRDTVIEGNSVSRSNRTGEDSGSIYLLGRSHVAMSASVTNNLIDDTGAAGDAHTIGIYLDDSSSDVRVRDNIVRDIGTHGVEIHGGDDILIENNLFDLRPNSHSAILFQAAPADTNPSNTMENNQVRRNVVLVRTAAQSAYAFIDGGAPAIGGNLISTPRATERPPVSDHDVRILAAGGGSDDYEGITALATALIGFEPIRLHDIGPDPHARCGSDE